MNNFEVKKIENCFKDSQTYEYKLNITLDEEIINKFSILGKVEIKNFRRPIFMINCKDNTKIKGIINSKVIRVSFENIAWEIRKQKFEAFIHEFTKSNTMGDNNGENIK